MEISNISKSDYTLISLKNNNGYECPTCKQKIHEKENPFISITFNGIFFNCRRSPDKKSTCLISFEHNEKKNILLMDDIIKKFINKEYNHPNDVAKDLKGVIAFSYAGSEPLIAKKVRTENGFTYHVSTAEKFYKSMTHYKVQHQETKNNKEFSVTYSLKNIITSNIFEYQFREGIRFVPLRPDQNPDDNKDLFNLFRGWQGKILPSYDENKINPIIKHFYEVYAKENQECMDYIIGYLATMVQNPKNKAQTSICLVGAEGSGKNIIFGWFIKYIIGTKYSFITDRLDYLTGRFNSSFINKMFIVCDEVSYQNDNYYVDMNRLKALVTNDTIAVERKGLEVEECENYSRIFIFSNNPRCLKLSTTDRRFAVFGTSDKYCKNKEYFDKLYKDLNEEVADNFLTYLLKYDISKWDHNAIPNTEERRNMMMTNELEFLFYHFNDFDSDGRTTTESFYEKYFSYCCINGIKSISKIKIIQSLRPYVDNCKWDYGKKRGFKKLFNRTEDDKIILNK